MRRKANKKGQLDVINAGMLSFMLFVLIVILTVLVLSTASETSLVCNANFDEGGCYQCNGTSTVVYNSTGNICYDTDGTESQRSEAGTAAYNSTMDLKTAANLPPQFGEIIVICIIIIGILGILSWAGFGVYQKMR